MQLKFGATNTRSQIGVSERIGSTLAGMTRSLLLDSDLPKYPWGELKLTAAYLSNRSPHSPLGMETPYMKIYGKEADVSLLKMSAEELSSISRPTSTSSTTKPERGGSAVTIRNPGLTAFTNRRRAR